MKLTYTSAACLLAVIALAGCESGAEFLGGSVLLVTIAGLLALALIVYAVVDLLKSSHSGTMKLVWGAIIVFAPFIGAILYLLIGKR